MLEELLAKAVRWQVIRLAAKIQETRLAIKELKQ